jgi:hypothetical protein
MARRPRRNHSPQFKAKTTRQKQGVQTMSINVNGIAHIQMTVNNK